MLIVKTQTPTDPARHGSSEPRKDPSDGPSLVVGYLYQSWRLRQVHLSSRARNFGLRQTARNVGDLKADGSVGGAVGVLQYFWDETYSVIRKSQRSCLKHGMQQTRESQKA